MFKKLLLFILFFNFMSLSGCGNGGAGENLKNTVDLKFSFWEPGMYRELENALQKIVNRYETEHPDVHIELVPKPVASYLDWMRMSIIADDMPDIESNYSYEIEKQYSKGYIVDITNIFNSESPYESGGPWKETFIADKFNEVNKNYQGAYCNIPFFGTEIAMFYNKTIYDELGLSVPRTWKEFMYNCRIIKGAGKIPIVLPGQKKDARTWLDWEIGQCIGIKKLLEDKNININRDSVISKYELSRAVLLGYYNVAEDETVQEIYRQIYKHYNEYLSYCDGVYDLEESIAKAMFINGEAVHINSGSWDVKSFLQNPEVQFEMGVFKFPEYTYEDTDYPGARMKIYASQSIAITKSVYKEEGKLEAAVDFLQYLTSKEVYQQFVNDTLELPVVDGITVSHTLSNFMHEGYPVESFVFQGFSIDDVISGSLTELDQDYFNRLREKEIAEAKEYISSLGLSAKNDYYYNEEVEYGYYKELEDGD